MSSVYYTDLIYIDWHVDPITGQKVTIHRVDEPHIVTNSRFILDYIPNEFNRVTLTYGSTPLSEIKLNKEITTATQFKVDYSIGWVYVHASLEAQNLLATYYSKGAVFYPASRIWYTQNQDGSIDKTLQQYVNSITNSSVTSSSTFQLDSDAQGVILKNASGNLEVRNYSDNGYADITVNNLTVKGTSTINAESETLAINSNVIVLNNDVVSSTPTQNAGIEVRRGSLTNASLLWDESNDVWKVGLLGGEVAITTISGTQTLTNKTLTAPKFANGGYIADVNGNELVVFTTTASAVNELTISNAISESNPSISASGGSTNISINMIPKGTGVLQVNGNTVWHTANDGAGSGLDADLLDGMQSSSADTLSTVVARDSNKTFGITAIDFTNQGANPTVQAVQGRVLWNSDEGALEYGTINNSVIQIGQETVYSVVNKTGSAISNGTLVMASGTIGNSGKIKVAPFIANGTVVADYIMGVTTHEIPNDGTGLVTHFGKIRGINTTGASVGETWADGDILWAHPTIAGALTKVKPTAPNVKALVAIVISAGNNGEIFVRPTYGSTLGGTDSNVEITNIANGHVLIYNSTSGIWENKAQSNLSIGNADTLDTYHASDFLTKTNTTEYTPTAQYHPATKKYVDDALSVGGYGDMLKATYDTNNDGKVNSADTADKLSSSRTITLSGDVTGSTSFDGSSNVTINTTIGGSLVTLTGTQTLSNKTLTAPKIASGGYIADANGNELIIFNTTTDAVNELTIANASSGNNPSISASGGGTNISINVIPKGTGVLQVNGSTVWHSGNDGSESGLDADLLDGYNSVDFVYRNILAYPGASADSTDANTYDWLTGTYMVGTNMANMPANSAFWYVHSLKRDANTANLVAYGLSDTTYVAYKTKASGTWSSWRKVWNEGNDGTGSGLDADTVDGIHGTALALKETAIVSVTNSKELALTDRATFQQCSSGSTITITIPLNSSVAFPTGTEIVFVRYNTGAVTFSATSGVTLNSNGSKKSIATQYDAVTLKKLGTDEWILVGSLSA